MKSLWAILCEIKAKFWRITDVIRSRWVTSNQNKTGPETVFWPTSNLTFWTSLSKNVRDLKMLRIDSFQTLNLTIWSVIFKGIITIEILKTHALHLIFWKLFSGLVRATHQWITLVCRLIWLSRFFETLHKWKRACFWRTHQLLP